jgi:FkbH-like protein
MNIPDLTALLKNLKKSFDGFKEIKIALVGDTATQFLGQAIRGIGYELKIKFELFEGDYNQIDRLLLDTSSELYSFRPAYIIVFHSVQKLRKKFYALETGDRKNLCADQIAYVAKLYETIRSVSSARVLYFNFCEYDDGVFGNYANKNESSFLFQTRNINVELSRLSFRYADLFVVDMAAIQNTLGRREFTDPKTLYSADMAISVPAVPLAAKGVCDIILACEGSFKKCLVLDLDNTVWGGVVGDDGIENIQIGELGIGRAYSEFQWWVKQLKGRGIIIAICSRNSEEIAKEPFIKHPDMVLRLDDISVFVANWDNKPDNIRYIQQVLNIGFDSMVFIDDSPFERENVRRELPSVRVPELPPDPAEYLDHLVSLNLFETASVSEEDAQRTKQYQVEAKRAVAQKSFSSEKEFLASLSMKSKVRPVEPFTAPRVAQLTQRSNQFNLRTIRYTDADILRIMASDEYRTFAFTLEDQFGDNGLISVVILQKKEKSLFIDTWIMSCRVLKRSMENFVLNELVAFASANGYVELVGEYLPTPKNGMVKDHYRLLGFKESGENRWVLKTGDYTERETFVFVQTD